MAQNLMQAGSGLPQLLFAGPLTVAPEKLYTCPANTSVKIAAASVGSLGTLATARVALGKTGTSGGTSTIGKNVPLTSGSGPNVLGSTVNPTTSTSLIAPMSGVITQMIIPSGGAGTLVPLIGSMNAAGTFFVPRVTLPAVAVTASVNTITGLSIPIYAGEILTFLLGTGSPSLYYGQQTGSTMYNLFPNGSTNVIVANYQYEVNYTISLANEASLLNYPVTANDSIIVGELANHTLGPGDYILASGSVANALSMVVSGVVFS